jgi:mannose-6-phosphate isomerase
MTRAAPSPYCLTFKPRFVEKIWGGRKLSAELGKVLPPGKQIGESWELYDFPPGVVDSSIDWISSEIAGGSCERKSLHWAVEQWGPDLYGSANLVGEYLQFPLLIKFLDAREDLSVQVHPDSVYAGQNPGAHLKTEAWYVLQSDPGSRLLNGLKPNVTRDQFEAAIANGSLENLIRAIQTKSGDCFYLPSGTVHALGAGILVAEVQTPSDTTFRVFDFNRIDASTGKPRTLHVEQALKCIDFSSGVNQQAAGPTSESQLVSSPFFEIHRFNIKGGSVRPVLSGEPRIIMVVDGAAAIRDGDNATPIMRGQTILIPAAVKRPEIHAASDFSWLEVSVPIGAK